MISSPALCCLIPFCFTLYSVSQAICFVFNVQLGTLIVRLFQSLQPQSCSVYKFQYKLSVALTLPAATQLPPVSACRRRPNVCSGKRLLQFTPLPRAWVHTVLRALWCWSAAIESGCNKNDFHVVCDLKEAPPLNRRYWRLCFLLHCNIEPAVRWQHSVACTRQPFHALLFVAFLRECCWPTSWVNTCPVKQTDKWMTHSRCEMTTFAHAPVCCFIELNHDRICNLSDLNGPPFLFKLHMMKKC